MIGSPWLTVLVVHGALLDSVTIQFKLVYYHQKLLSIKTMTPLSKEVYHCETVFFCNTVDQLLLLQCLTCVC